MCHNGCIQAGGDLSCAGDFRSVADNPRYICQRVLHGHFDLVQGPAHHIGESRTTGTGGGDRAAEGGQLADICLLVYGQKVGKY